jgi:Holliday junction resolvase RusA-like endonuclease
MTNKINSHNNLIELFKNVPEGSKLYVIHGKPIPLARARHGNRRTWDSQKADKVVWGINLRQQHGDRPFWEGPLVLNIIFYMKVPKVTKSKLWGKPHKARPDLSNLIKFVEDVGSGIIYDDDSSIAACYAQKVYDEIPRTEFLILPWSTT